MKKIIGTVPFVNSYPLTFYINNIDSNINLKFFYPNNLMESLIQKKANISLLPIANHFTNNNAFSLDKYCISSTGKVKSVILVSKSHYKDINTIFFDTRSKSSNLLMRVIAEKFFKISFESKTHVPTRNMIFEPNIGYVVIGDLGLEISTSRMSGLQIYDLGEIWFNETGYPFTFASFNYVETPSQDLIDVLDFSFKRGIESLDKILDYIQNINDIYVSQKYIEEYLRENIVYKFSKDHISGIDLFFSLVNDGIMNGRAKYNEKE